MRESIKLPFYAKGAFLLIGFYLLLYMLSIGQEIILPILYAAIITVLLSPMVDFMVKKKVNRILAVSLLLIISSLVFSALLVFIAWRITELDADLPELISKFESMLDQLVHWISQRFHIREWAVNLWVTDTKKELMNGSNAAIGLTFTAMSGFLATMVLTPVYVFLMLVYEPHLIQFVHRLFAKTKIDRVDKVVADVNGIVKNYLFGKP